MVTRLAPLLFPPIRFLRPPPSSVDDSLSPESLTRLAAGQRASLAVPARLTRDGIVVTTDRSAFGSFFRRRAIEDVESDQIDSPFTTLDVLLDLVGESEDLLLSVRPGAAAAVGRAVAISDHSHERIWIADPDLDALTQARESAWTGRLVHCVRLSQMARGPERHAAELAHMTVDGVEMHHTDWTGGLTTLFHRFGIACFAQGAVHEREFDGLFDMGIDGITSSNPQTVERSFATFYGDDPPPVPRDFGG